MFDYLDTKGFLLRTTLQAGDVQHLETVYPGWILQTLRSWSSRINAQLRKRYGDAPNVSNILPLGQQAPVLVPEGTQPPALTLSGRPVLGCMQLLVQVTGAGALGTAVFKWSPDNGVTWNTGVTSVANIPLTGTGLVLSMSPGPYAVDNVYAAAPPVPEVVLLWLTTLVTWDSCTKRGRNPQDPLIVDLKEDRLRVLAEIKEAADSNDGSYDLPISEDRDTAITTGSTLASSQSGPYAWTDVQASQINGGLPGFAGGCGNGGPCV